MDIKKVEQMGMEQGFSHVVLLDCDTIEHEAGGSTDVCSRYLS